MALPETGGGSGLASGGVCVCWSSCCSCYFDLAVSLCVFLLVALVTSIGLPLVPVVLTTVVLRP